MDVVSAAGADIADVDVEFDASTLCTVLVVVVVASLELDIVV